MSARTFGLPVVPPRVDSDGRVYTSKYQWQETIRGRRGSAWLNPGRPCNSRGLCCGCFDRERLCLAAQRFVHPGDDIVRPVAALKLIRPYLPHIQTTAQLFVAAA